MSAGQTAPALYARASWLLPRLSYRTAALCYLLAFLGLTWPYWLGGEVIAPHRQFVELAAHDGSDAQQIENRKFSDFTNGYIPEIHELLQAPRSGWLGLWTERNELGRPLHQLSGFSPAYAPSWLLSRIVRDPWVFITMLSLLTCAAAGLFVLLFCREVALAPMAGLVAGLGLAASPLFMYWLTFPMFPAIWCWGAAVLWAVTRLDRTPDLLGWSALAFAAYSLLMTAYPQPVVFHAYLLGGYGLWLTVRRSRTDGRAALRFVALCASALVVGGALALPVYLDLLQTSAESARVAPDPSFFTVVLPRFPDWLAFYRFVVLSTVPELFGNPISTAYPLPYDGLSLTVVTAFFAVVALLLALRRTWGWWLAIALLCLLAFEHSLYVFGVQHLGFHLSRSTPLGSLALPLTVITAFGVDAAQAHARRGPHWAAACCCLALLALGIAYGLSHDLPIRWWMAAALVLTIGLLALPGGRVQTLCLSLATVVVLACVSYPLMLHQAPQSIATTSDLVERVRHGVPAGSRFAVAAPGLHVLPPNLNAGVGMASLHSYNSLSARRYHHLITALGGEMQVYGRWNGSIAPDYGGAMFWMSNVSMVLSSVPLEHPNLMPEGETSAVLMHRVVSRMGQARQVFLPPGSPKAGDQVTVPDPRLLSTHAPTILRDTGDALEFELMRGAASLLIVSQKFHRAWQASVQSQPDGVWSAAPTVEVNGVFQGVWLPADAQRVQLDFLPHVRHAWIGHLVWQLLCALLLAQAWHGHARQRTPAASSPSAARPAAETP